MKTQLTYNLKDFYGSSYTLAPIQDNYAKGNTLAIVLYDVKNDETFDVLTTNLLYSRELEPDEAFVDTSKKWAINFIEENKLGKKIMRMAISGFNKYQAYKFDLAKINQPNVGRK